MAANEYLKIPGNIKQMYLPFVLDPNNPIHSVPLIASRDAVQKGQTNDVSVTGNSGTPQFFSFRPDQPVGFGITKPEDSFGFLHILPNSFYQNSYEGHDNDIANRLLYADSMTLPIHGTELLRDVPYMQVREYLQDSKLDMIFNVIGAFANGLAMGQKAANADQGFMDFATRVWNFTKSVFSDIGTILGTAFNAAIDPTLLWKYANNTSPDYDNYVLKIPYMLYYRLLSSTTTGIYEIPYNGKILYESNGTGFDTAKGIKGLASPNNATLIGSIINYVGKNIRVNTTPTFDGSNNDTPTSVDINFTLYNDSLDAAVKNFIFVNTLFPGAKWLQYHIFQHAPNLYDIKINGINRLFMCAGDFKCEQKGVLRKPRINMLQILANNHKNKNMSLTAFDLAVHDMVRIPDIYEITLKFTSLLPNNFNNFLYSYYLNESISSEKYKNNLHTNSVYYSVSDAISKELAARWNAAMANTDIQAQPNSQTAAEESQEQDIDPDSNVGKSEAGGQ